MTPAEFVEALRTDFEVEKIGGEVYRPARLHNFAMYLDGAWYSLTAREGTYDDDDPIGVLDVTVLSNRVLDKLLDIKDLRTSTSGSISWAVSADWASCGGVWTAAR